MDSKEPAPKTDEIAPNDSSPRQRSLSLRAVGLALLIFIVSAAVADYHDGVILHRGFALHNYAAPVVVCLFFVFVLLGNAVLFRIWRPLALRAGELAVALTLALAVSPLPQYFARGLVGTVGETQAFLENQHPTMRSIQKTGVDPWSVLPPESMLSTEDSQEFVGSLSEEVGQLVPPQRVPWSVWVRPLLFWCPLVLVFLAFSVSAGYLVYRQWAKRELLSFPLAEFAAALTERKSTRAWPDVFYSRLFWAGLFSVVVLQSMAGLAAHYENMISIPLGWRYTEVVDKLPFLKESFEGYSLLRAWLFLAVIAIAYLLPAELGFTAWFMWPVMVCATYVYYTQTGERFGGSHAKAMAVGSWWAMAGLILFAGRRYYLGLLRAALFGRRGAPQEVERQGVFLARIFLLSLAGLVVGLHAYGLAWDLAVLWTASLSVMFLVLCRLVAEMGILWTPLIQVGPLAMLLAMIGPTGLGTRAYALMSVLGTALIPARSSILLIAPAVTNAAHVEGKVTGSNPSLKVIAPFFLVALVISVALLVWFGYSHTGDMQDNFLNVGGSDRTVKAATQIQTLLPGKAEQEGVALTAENTTDLVGRPESWQNRWGAASPEREGFWTLFAIGFILVAATGALRVRFPRFPLHPLPLVLLGTWLMSRYWTSFLIGWGLKRMILRIGGGRLFEQSRPFFVGVMTGLAVSAMIWVTANMVIYWQNDMTFQSEWWIWMQQIYSF